GTDGSARVPTHAADTDANAQGATLDLLRAGGLVANEQVRGCARCRFLVALALQLSRDRRPNVAVEYGQRLTGCVGAHCYPAESLEGTEISLRVAHRRGSRCGRRAASDQGCSTQREADDRKGRAQQAFRHRIRGDALRLAHMNTSMCR